MLERATLALCIRYVSLEISVFVASDHKRSLNIGLYLLHLLSSLGQARSKNGEILGLKVCVKYEPEQIISMQRGSPCHPCCYCYHHDNRHPHNILHGFNPESKKMEFIGELGVVPYTAILEAGDDYAVKEWADGERHFSSSQILLAASY